MGCGVEINKLKCGRQPLWRNVFKQEMININLAVIDNCDLNLCKHMDFNRGAIEKYKFTFAIMFFIKKPLGRYY